MAARVQLEQQREGQRDAKPAAAIGDDRLPAVEAAMDLVRPAVRDDGGDVDVVDIRGDTVFIKFRGACVACPSREMTLKHGIEAHLAQQVEGIRRVVEVEP